MRVLRFRAWDEDGFMFWPDKLTFGTFGNKDSIVAWRGDHFGTVGSAIVELMMWTGLKDQRGKSIYEKDIVTCVGWNGPSILKWNETFACWAFTNGEHLNDWDPGLLKVVGNIYEDKGLVEEINEE